MNGTGACYYEVPGQAALFGLNFEMLIAQLGVCFSQFQGLLDSKGLKRLVTSFERKVWHLVRGAKVTADHDQSHLRD